MERDFHRVVRGFEEVLAGLGVDDGPHTARTAERAAKAWFYELCAGLGTAPPDVTTFPSEGKSEMIVLRDIPIRSICAHHLLGFIGTAAIAYIPGKGQILGLSKLSRIADYWARRPQVQEDLTNQIADAVAAHVMGTDFVPGTRMAEGGVGVLIKANHTCVEMRGVKHAGNMVTSALRGAFHEAAVRDEFLRLAGF